MSNALHQIQRVNLHESRGNSDGGRGTINTQYCVDLTPTPEEIKKELVSYTTMKVSDKSAL